MIRDCARQAKIWDKAYTLPSIPDGKCNNFFELASGFWHGNNTWYKLCKILQCQFTLTWIRHLSRRASGFFLQIPYITLDNSMRQAQGSFEIRDNSNTYFFFMPGNRLAQLLHNLKAIELMLKHALPLPFKTNANTSWIWNWGWERGRMGN